MSVSVMDYQLATWFCAIACSVLMYVWRRRSLRLPPGPRGWPIVGNLFQIGRKANEGLWVLSQQYGPLMTLSLGMKTTVVVSNGEMAKEVLKTQDQIFSGRTVMEAAKVLSHHKSSIAWAQYGAYWRKLRRVATTQFFTAKRLQDLQYLRRAQISETIAMIYKDKGNIVNLDHVSFYVTLNVIAKMIFSRSVFDPYDPDSVKFKDAFKTSIDLAGQPNLVDFFPFLSFLDLQGIHRGMTTHLHHVFKSLDLLIQDRLATTTHKEEADGDFLDVLLHLRAHDFTLTNIRAVIFELMTAGSDPTAATIEWAMAEVIRHPHVMKQVNEELEKVVGFSRRVEECDIERLPYLQAVVKEVLRLHPALPLTLPHRADSSCEVGGFIIPKNTQVFLNLWAIGRDPASWNEPLKFMPERFLNVEKDKVSFKGHDFGLIPFGAGRRICIGLPLADRIVHFTVASLLHSFQWNLPHGMSAEQLDMSDTFGVVLKKATVLRAIPIPRLPHHLYS